MKKLKKKSHVIIKPAGIRIDLAFVLIRRGILLDLGIVRTHRKKRSLYRLHQEVLKRSKKQEVPEQLGLLFALHRLYGPLKTKYTLKDGSKQSILVFNEYGPKGRRSSDYPGLVSYFNRFTRLHFPKSHSDGLGPSETHNTDQLKNEIGNDLVFKGKELQWLYNRRGKRNSDRIIIATGELEHKKILLLEATNDERKGIYSALRRLDLQALKAYEVTKKQVRDYIEALQTKIVTKIPFNADHCAKEGKETKLAEDPQTLHRKIVELVDEALELDILIRPSDWDNRAEKWRDLIMPQIVTHLPAARINAGPEKAEDLVSHSLSQISKHYSEIRLLLAAHFALQGKYEAALKELRAYSDNNFKDAFPYILIGYIQFELMQYDMAIQSYDEAHRRGDRAMAAVGTSLTYLYAGNMPEATKWINIGLKYDPKSRSGRIVKAMLLRMDSKYEEALRLSEQLLKENHNDGYAMAQRAWCLYTLRRYRNAFKEARRLLALKKGLHVSAYSIIASSLCEMNKLLFAKRFIKRVLTVASDGPDKTNMYRTLRSIALKQGKHREAVRCAVRMCRLSPEKPLPKLWLIQGLRNTGHPSLARRFAAFSIDRSQLSEYETAEIARAYIFLEDFYKAADFAGSISNENILRIVIREIGEYYLAQLYIGLSYLLNMRLMGVERGDWRGPFDTFMRLFRIMPQKDITKFMLYEPFVLLTLLVRNEDFAREWCRRWEKVPHEQIPTQTRGLGCWRIYARLKWFETNEDVETRICKVCKKAFDELTELSLFDSMSLTVTSLTAIVLIEIGESRSNTPVLERLFSSIEDLKSEQITLGSMCALSLLSIMLARKAQISYVVRLASLVRPFMRLIQDKRIACDLAYILSIGCRAAVVLQDVNVDLENLLTEVSSFLSELEGDDLTQRLWPVKWNFGLACIHDMFKRNVEDDKLSDRIQMLMDEINRVEIPEIMSRRYACAFLGSVTCYAFNYYRDQLGNSLFNKWKETFLLDRALSSQTRLMRIRIEGTISNRPVDEIGLMPIMEDSDPELMRGWEERLLTWIQVESLDADSRNDLTRRIMKLTDSVEFFKTRPKLDASQ